MSAPMRPITILLFTLAAKTAVAARYQKSSATAGETESALTTANPVRKVVNLLQSMAKKIEAEGKKEDDLYAKFSCYCKSGTAELQDSIANANTKSPAVAADIKAAEEKLAQTKQGLKDAQKERADAKSAIAAATAIREKDAAAFAAEKAELEQYIAQLKAAIAAIEKGMAGGFLQTGGAAKLRKIVTLSSSLDDDQKEGLLSFLSGKQGASYVPSSGEVIGMLKQMLDDMSKALANAAAAEKQSASDFGALVGAKNKEINTLTDSVEAKSDQVGELGVAIVRMKDDLTETEERLLGDKEMLAQLEKGCSDKDKEYAERVKTRGEELAAIMETIKILNDDDALELFKKTLPAPSASLMQVASTTAEISSRALRALDAVGRGQYSGLGFIVVALKGKKIGFDKIIKMIDELVEVLKKEQKDDADKKEYCALQLDGAEDKKKGLELKVSDLETAITSAKEGIAAVKEEIAALEAQIKSLDKMVAEATQQRKDEAADYKLLVQSDSAAQELLGFAKNRLYKFYDPKLYNPPAKAELSSMGAISRDMASAASFVELSQRVHLHSAVEPPPETWNAYAKKTEESVGVIEMIDLLIKDLEKELAEAATAEKDAQADYDATVASAKEQRISLSKALTDKTAALADMQADLETSQTAKGTSTKELMATDKFLAQLHAECDWLLQYFDVRKEARAGEIDALGKAKGVLSGADYSLLQTSLRGSA